MNFNNTQEGFGKLPYAELALLPQNQSSDNPKSLGEESIPDNIVSFEPEKEQGKDVCKTNEEPVSIDDLFFDTTKSSKSLIAEISKELYEREELKQKNLLRIDYDIIKAKKYLSELDSAGGGINPNLASRRRTSLDLQIFNLYREIRDQYVSHFRDHVFLKKDLLTTLREYWASQRENQLFAEEDELPTEYVVTNY